MRHVEFGCRGCIQARDGATRTELEAIVTCAMAADRAALEALLRRHQRWVHAIAVRTVVSPAEAADLTQEALLRVVTRIGQFEADRASELGRTAS